MIEIIVKLLFAIFPSSTQKAKKKKKNIPSDIRTKDGNG